MKIFSIRRYRMPVRDIYGTEKDLYAWIHDNVPMRGSAGGIRSANARPKDLRKDAEAAGYTIRTTIIRNNRDDKA